MPWNIATSFWGILARYTWNDTHVLLFRRCLLFSRVHLVWSQELIALVHKTALGMTRLLSTQHHRLGGDAVWLMDFKVVTIASHDDIYIYIIRCLLKADVWTVACFDFYGAGFHHYEAFPCYVALCWVLFFAMGWVQIYRVSFANSCRITVYCVHDMWVP